MKTQAGNCIRIGQTGNPIQRNCMVLSDNPNISAQLPKRQFPPRLNFRGGRNELRTASDVTRGLGQGRDQPLIVREASCVAYWRGSLPHFQLHASNKVWECNHSSSVARRLIRCNLGSWLLSLPRKSRAAVGSDVSCV